MDLSISKGLSEVLKLSWSGSTVLQDKVVSACFFVIINNLGCNWLSRGYLHFSSSDAISCTQCVLNYSWIVLCSLSSKICVYRESAQNRADSYSTVPSRTESLQYIFFLSVLIETVLSDHEESRLEHSNLKMENKQVKQQDIHVLIESHSSW
jgi:hypothetical protein